MKKTIATIALLAGAASLANAQTTWVAGWDFNQYKNGGTLDQSTSFFPDYKGYTLDAILSSYNATDPNFYGSNSADYGTLYYNGQFTSTDVSGTLNIVPRDGEFMEGANLEQGKDFNIGGKEFNFGPNPALGSGSFVFEATTNGNGSLTDWFIQFGGKDELTTKTAEPFTVSFSTDGSDYTLVDTFTLNDAETLYSTSLNAQSAFTDTVYFKFAFSNLDSSDAMPLIDNVAIGGVVPEPSTYAAIFGAIALGLAVVRRRLRK